MGQKFITRQLVFDRVASLYGGELPPKSRRLVNYVLNREMGLSMSEILREWDIRTEIEYSGNSSITRSVKSFSDELEAGYPDLKRHLEWVLNGVWEWDLGSSEIALYKEGAKSTHTSHFISKEHVEQVPEQIKNRMLGVLKKYKDEWYTTHPLNE